jgi:hypothetical protein
MKPIKLVNGARNWFGTLAFLALLVAGLAYAAVLIERVGLERDAIAEAGKLARSVIQPALTGEDLDGPMSGGRYAEMRALVKRRVLRPPVSSVEIWNKDDTVVFADRAGLVGNRSSSMLDALHDARSGAATHVEGDTLQVLVGIHVDGGGDAVVEIDRSNAAIVEQAREHWNPWVARALRAAVILLALYVVAVALSIVLRRRRARAGERLPKGLPKTARRTGPKTGPQTAPKPAAKSNAAPAPAAAAAKAEPVADGRKTKAPAPVVPPYVQPGFRENVEARREAEAALVSTKQALEASEGRREHLQKRLTKAESELEDAKRRLGELDPTRR